MEKRNYRAPTIKVKELDEELMVTVSRSGYTEGNYGDTGSGITAGHSDYGDGNWGDGSNSGVNTGHSDYGEGIWGEN